MAAGNTYDLAVCSGEFTLPRQADLALLRDALARAPRLLVLLTAARLPRSPRHPFSWEERAAVLREALPPADRPRVGFAPLRTRPEQDRMAAQALRAVQADAGPAARVLRLRTGAADFPTPAGWDEAEAALPSAESMATLRERLWTSDTPDAALAALSPHVPEAVLRFLGDWLRTPDHPRLRDEWAQIAREKAAWAVAPYPVVLVTVDVVARAAGHVLLIRRGRAPGLGLRALPGGFLDVDETVYQSALRELAEETGLSIGADALRAVQVFDDPQRSQRGRVVTHAHFFELPGSELPPVQGGDDAAAASWVPQAALAAMEDQFLDDHFLILDHFLGLTGDD